VIKFRIAILASGSGSNFQKIVENSVSNSGYLNSDVELLIYNNKDAFVAKRAERLGIKSFHISAKTEGTRELESKKILEVLDNYSIDLIVLSGYMKKLSSEFISKYRARILNIHPSLLPKYGGEKFYGMKVHNAVFKSRDKISGATVHLVDEIYDNGKILEQIEVDISKVNSAAEIAEIVLKEEHKLFSNVIKKIEKGIIKL